MSRVTYDLDGDVYLYFQNFNTNNQHNASIFFVQYGR